MEKSTHLAKEKAVDLAEKVEAVVANVDANLPTVISGFAMVMVKFARERLRSQETGKPPNAAELKELLCSAIGGVINAGEAAGFFAEPGRTLAATP